MQHLLKIYVVWCKIIDNNDILDTPERLQTKLRRGRLNYVGVDRAGKFCAVDAIVALPKKNASDMNGPIAVWTDRWL